MGGRRGVNQRNGRWHAAKAEAQCLGRSGATDACYPGSGAPASRPSAPGCTAPTHRLSLPQLPSEAPMDQHAPAFTDPHAEIRAEVAKLCARFPGEYWRKLDQARAYPTEFVRALTEGGYLAALIPEEYGGAGLTLSAAAAILETVQAEGCNGAACHAQMYIMGTILRHGSDAQKTQYLPKIATGELRLQAFGVTEPTSGTDTTSLRTFARRDGDHYVVNGQKVWTSRAEHSDLMLLLARTTPRDDVKRRTDGLSTFIVDMQASVGKGITIRPIRTMMNHNSTE